MTDKPGCRINDCGNPFVPLDSGMEREEDNFRLCADHKRKLLQAAKRLRGDD